MENGMTFWEWVAKPRAGDTPRGDFIRDTRALLCDGLDPEVALASANSVAYAEYERLVRQYDREVAATGGQ